MGFQNVRFPTDISAGSVGGPGYKTLIVTVDSGAEERTARRSQMKHKYDVVKGVQKTDQLHALKTFHIAMRGAEDSFRFKDFVDFHSNPTNPSYYSSPGTKDQRIGVGDGVTTQFQLIKNYTLGAVNRVRTISTPVDGTVRVWVNNVEKTSGVDFTVNDTTGIVVFGTAPTSGHNIDASFEFDVKVRFGESLDNWLDATLGDFNSGSVRSVPLEEVFESQPAYSNQFFFGGSKEVAITANTEISLSQGRFWVISASSGLVVSLEDFAAYPTGAPIMYVNNSGSNAFTLKDHLGTTLATIGAGEEVELKLSLTALGAKVWYAS